MKDELGKTQEEEYRQSVEQSQSDACEETMWGKPARDIITGISNNTSMSPVRAIGELVQNARDRQFLKNLKVLVMKYSNQ